jgi:hypothetical protein
MSRSLSIYRLTLNEDIFKFLARRGFHYFLSFYRAGQAPGVCWGVLAFLDTAAPPPEDNDDQQTLRRSSGPPNSAKGAKIDIPQ